MESAWTHPLSSPPPQIPVGHHGLRMLPWRHLAPPPSSTLTLPLPLAQSGLPDFLSGPHWWDSLLQPLLPFIRLSHSPSSNTALTKSFCCLAMDNGPLFHTVLNLDNSASPLSPTPLILPTQLWVPESSNLQTGRLVILLISSLWIQHLSPLPPPCSHNQQSGFHSFPRWWIQ